MPAVLMPRLLLAVLAALSSVAPLDAARGGPDATTLQTVMTRAGSYVAEFHRRFAGLVGEERYTQNWETVWTGRRNGTTKFGERVLLSDLLLVKPQGADDWLQYRDVFEVDGHRVRERTERLPDLLSDRSASAAAQVERKSVV